MESANLICFHGVLANAKLRSEIIPSPPEQATEPSTDDAHAQGAPARLSWARLLKTGLRHRTLPELPWQLDDHAAIEDPPVIDKILTPLGLPPRPPRAPAQRFDLFQRSEEPKTACQRKPTAPLALRSSERRDLQPFALVRPLRRPSEPKQHGIFIKQKGN